MVKKYNSLLIFATIEIGIALLSLHHYIQNNSALLSVFTALFLIVTPAFYYFTTTKNETEFTFWFVFYSVFKITPYIFKMEGNFFEVLFQFKIYLNIALLVFLLWKAFVFMQNFREAVKQKDTLEQDEYSIISDSLKKSIKFKKLGKMIAFEVCSFYYCFIKWTRNKSSENNFSGYRNSGVSAVYIGLMLASVFEAIGLHVYLISRNATAAFVILVLHIYLLINLTGHLKAIFFRSHLILSQKIVIRYGLFETLQIPLDSITTIQKFEGDYEKSTNLVKFALLGNLEPHNVSIQLKENITVALPFGISKKPKQILLYIDNLNDFLRTVTDRIEAAKTFDMVLPELEKSM
ncbi:hypothetical protein BC749_10472 [Flavobacterium araucananum]|uniref:Beta-carotene 15,15'-monooxygenase n=1 Tax=Flavobacterium araucananum TaxID=946678 RepID=A0A227NFV2_9FLAO|nr:hypothetical protein [Flavobacterium araucananum]OXE96514.1 hypothetical protein B0A64_23865 [Flavobacterium araucananum]PWJ98928.1 hypothetical protein BC749_10472 [Flavobacterium araucananum]